MSHFHCDVGCSHLAALFEWQFEDEMVVACRLSQFAVVGHCESLFVDGTSRSLVHRVYHYCSVGEQVDTCAVAYSVQRFSCLEIFFFHNFLSLEFRGTIPVPTASYERPTPLSTKRLVFSFSLSCLLNLMCCKISVYDNFSSSLFFVFKTSLVSVSIL